MWLMLQQDKPDDYVVATGESHSVRECLDVSFGALELDWKKYVEIDPRYFRPTEVDHLHGDPEQGQARARLESEGQLQGPDRDDGQGRRGRRPGVADRAAPSA
jgi:GDPmannose 4,6-dehydratase